MKKAIIAVYAFMACITGANAADADWKFYGVAENKQQCFYDANSVTPKTAGHLRVWTKCLDEAEMEAAASDAIIKRTAEKIVLGYMPPIARVFSFPSSDQILAVVQSETTATDSYLKPTATIYWELSCSEKMIGTLQISTRKGAHKTWPQADWTYAGPETNGERLLKMVCR